MKSGKKKHYSSCVGSSVVIIVVFASDNDALLAAVFTPSTFWLGQAIVIKTCGPNRHTKTAKST